MLPRVLCVFPVFLPLCYFIYLLSWHSQHYFSPFLTAVWFPPTGSPCRSFSSGHESSAGLQPREGGAVLLGLLLWLRRLTDHHTDSEADHWWTQTVLHGHLSAWRHEGQLLWVRTNSDLFCLDEPSELLREWCWMFEDGMGGWNYGPMDEWVGKSG